MAENKKTIQDVLKNLNKSASEGDMFKLASDMPREAFDVTLSSMGSPYLDYRIGGIGMGRMSLFTGWEGSGKTSFAIIGAACMQRDFGRIAAYFDGENSVTNSHMDRFNINRELFFHRKENNLEQMLDQAEEFASTKDTGMIIIDSVKSFGSSTVEEKSAQDNYIGLEAKKYNARMPIIMGKCQRNDIALVIINQWRENPGAMMGDPRVLPGGHWQKYMPSLHLDFGTKRDKILLYDEYDEIIGHTMDIRVMKSRYKVHAKKDIINANFYYDYGFDKYDEYCALMVEKGIIEKKKKSSWYYFPDGHKEQGFEPASAYLSEIDEKVFTDWCGQITIPKTTIENQEEDEV